MKKIILILAAVAILTTSCARKPVDTTALLDKYYSSVPGEILYKAPSFIVVRIRVDGKSYLVNSEGGIVKE